MSLVKTVSLRNAASALLRSAAPMRAAARRGVHIEQEGIPGANLPFDINNRHKLLAVFILYFGSGLTAPFILVRHQLLKD
jgi:cytochrome c oxidase subunit 7c